MSDAETDRTEAAAAGTGPLQGITVIDCTMNLAGPFGTALLADLGADVIKVTLFPIRQDYWIDRPPSTSRQIPVRNSASLEAKNA